MHSTIAISSLLVAASSVIALPQGTNLDTSVTVILQNQAIELGSQTTFGNVNSAQTQPPVGSSGPYSTIEINLGADVANTALRCQALDVSGAPLIAIRGDNTDTTFSDADKGAWTFLQPSEVSAVVCDPAFVAVAPGSYDVVVTLSGPSELATQTTLSGVKRDIRTPTASGGPYNSINIAVGPLVSPELRCKVKNQANRAIVATRGENIDTTFSDADKGAWAFQKESAVSNIICDPRFVAKPQ
ncbi:uncharacterized protein LTR77_005215 [Saxophila tyrrhenica]|uniref:Uncharacterized protein n=1 Tax=Saxophila tyrrhenica TaxID=1690608 RepID=A0AAV9PC84_9PEZI|nr:hypothetical protein LTR77_005215 [Saxophila tyrrhenica]